MSMLSEFKAFAVKGNVMDLAVGVIIGGAFGKIVDSLVSDMIMPIAGLFLGKIDFSSLYVVIGANPGNLATLAELKKAGIAVFAYGNFILASVNFIILAWVVFMMVKALNTVRKPAEAEPAAPPPEDTLLLREIRDALKK